MTDPKESFFPQKGSYLKDKEVKEVKEKALEHKP